MFGQRLGKLAVRENEQNEHAAKMAPAYPWLEIKCSRCQTPRDVDLCALPHVPTTCVHDLAGRLVCQKCKKAGKRPAATLLKLAPRSCQPPPEN
jgi:hypothetical protein